MKFSLGLVARLLVVCLLASFAVAGQLTRYERTKLQMGTAVRIVVYAEDEATARKVSESAFCRVDELEAIMSHYRETSEISRLSAKSGTGPVAISRELSKILDAAVGFSKKTNGAFDVTVGPLVDLWKTTRRAKKMPSDAEMQSARARTGFRYLVVDAGKSTAELKLTGMKLDLSAIAKGYAADEALRVLRERGYPRALVDAGGDIALGDPPPGKKGWSVQVQKVPGEPEGAVKTLVLKNRAIATSGDTYQYAEIGGTRYSHILDPKTGLGMREAASATVVAPDCLSADALATSLCVLPVKDGLKLVENLPGASAYIVRRSGEKLEHFASDSFPP